MSFQNQTASSLEETNDKNSAILSCSSNSSSSLSACFDNITTNVEPNPTPSSSATTLTMRPPPSGGGSQTKRHSVRSNSSCSSNNQPFTSRQASSSSLDRSSSQIPQRPSSPITSPSIHKSLTALDAKSIARDMEKSALQQRGDNVMSPTSPANNNNNTITNANNYYFGNGATGNPSSFQSMAAPSATSSQTQHYQYLRQNSMSSVTLPAVVNHHHPVQGDAWQSLCVRVLPLFNGEGVQGAIEDLNDLLRYFGLNMI